LIALLLLGMLRTLCILRGRPRPIQNPKSKIQNQLHLTARISRHTLSRRPLTRDETVSPMSKLSTRFDDAVVYAAEAHRMQTRKGTSVPYISHVLAVAALAVEYGANEDEAIAALLHDVVEDCGGMARLADVRNRFGPVVADIVMGCTDATEIPKPPWNQRKQAYLKQLENAGPSVALVAACDKLHNARSIVRSLQDEGLAAWDRFTGGKERTLWYYRAVLDVLSRRLAPTALLRDLRTAVIDLHRLADSQTAISDVSFPDA
jgi:(p)ppGpp synthase/HD superfamily hydrolase